ncbi:MAG: phosphocholine cytidylyltransferase family protein [Lachnospiraceae bacterium]|nr:phosphocholine cytidylyltransferase family protein [Lachnospiraceae bacterium]
MQALILAAGMGKRLKEYTENNTKCMVKVNGVSLIERMLRELDGLELQRIIIVTGYKSELLKGYIESLGVKTPLVFVENKIYDTTNNIYSLFIADKYLLEDDTLLLESDLITEHGVIKGLAEDERDSVALVDKYDDWMDGTCLKLDENDNIIDFIPGKKFCEEEKSEYYKTVNMYKFSRGFSTKYYVPFMEAYRKAMGDNVYYESVIGIIRSLEGQTLKARRLNGEKWYEIDNENDLRAASELFK